MSGTATPTLDLALSVSLGLGQGASMPTGVGFAPLTAETGWEVALTVAMALVAVLAGSPVVTWLFRQVDRRPSVRAEPHPGEAERRPGRGRVDRRSVLAAAQHLPGGRWIGHLERLAVYVAVLTGVPEGIAMALAIKGLARYPELQAGQDTAAAERFIIGTFASVLWACGCAGVTLLGWRLLTG